MSLIGLTFDTIAGIMIRLNQQGFDEPVARFEESDFNKLESSLKTPFLRPTLDSPVDDFCDKASILFFSLTENHCLENSNKRVAVSALITFADLNGYSIKMSNITLYALSMAITLLSKYGLIREAKEEIKMSISQSIARKPGVPLDKTEQNKLEDEFVKFMNTNHSATY